MLLDCSYIELPLDVKRIYSYEPFLEHQSGLPSQERIQTFRPTYLASLLGRLQACWSKIIVLPETPPIGKRSTLPSGEEPTTRSIPDPKRSCVTEWVYLTGIEELKIYTVEVKNTARHAHLRWLRIFWEHLYLYLYLLGTPFGSE